MTSAAPQSGFAWVLEKVHVRRALRTLIGRPTHPHFLAYLHLRQVSVRDSNGALVGLKPVWAEVGEVLRVPDAPATKPFLRPFQAKANRAETYYWLNDNIAGSFAPSSMRAGTGGLGAVFDLDADKSFSLRVDHAQAALRSLLHDERMPAQPLAAFLLRDYGLVDVDPPGPTVSTLVELFRETYGLTDDAEFLTVYDPDVEWNPQLQSWPPGEGFYQVPFDSPPDQAS